jgi:AcrR family transcriptional regulator
MTRAESRAQTRTRVLEAAAAVFVDRGFAGAAIEEIAERAGFTKGAVYGNFADKTELFLAVLDERARTSIAEIARLFEGPSEAVIDRLRQRSSRRGHDEAWSILNAEFWLYAMRNPEARRRLAEHDRLLRDAYAAAVTAQFDAIGVKLPAPVADVAIIVQVLDQGIIAKHFIDPHGVREGFFFDVISLLFTAATALSESQSRGTRNPAARG